MIITGRNSELTNIRAKDLNISVVFQGVDNKAEVLRKYIAENKLSSSQFAYIGDDLNDYVVMKLCAFKACPADAAKEIRAICDYVSLERGGFGAVRDICEYLLRKQNRYGDFLRIYSV